MPNNNKSKIKGSKNKKIATAETQKQKFSASDKFSASVVARKTSKVKRAGSKLTIDVYNTKGRVTGKISLPKEIFGAKINNQLLAQAVRVYLANQRKGTASTKTRGEVSGSTRKIWRQKGTGRARHGSRKAPIFVGGGIYSGPKPRDFSLKMSKKMKRLALFSALSAKLNNKEIKAVTGLEKLTPKTKLMAEVINNLGVNGEKKDILMIAPESKGEFENVYRAARNIEGLRIINANTLNTYEVLNNKLILLMNEAITTMKKIFLKGQNN